MDGVVQRYAVRCASLTSLRQKANGTACAHGPASVLSEHFQRERLLQRHPVVGKMIDVRTVQADQEAFVAPAHIQRRPVAAAEAERFIADAGNGVGIVLPLFAAASIDGQSPSVKLAPAEKSAAL